MALSPRRRWLRHALVRYRRPLAAGCAFLAVLMALTALQPTSAVGRSGGKLDVGGGTATTAGVTDGLVAAPVRLADAEVAQLLQPGVLVDVLAADRQGPATVVAPAVEVLSIPAPNDSGLTSGGYGGALVVLAVTSSQATALAGASANGLISVVLLAPVE